MTSTRPSLTRLFTLHNEIACGAYPSLARLADVCGVNERTVKRDLKALRVEQGAPLEYSRERNGYRYARAFSMAQLPLSPDEMVAVCMLQAMVPAFRNTHFAPAMACALGKMELMLPETVWVGREADEHITFMPDAAPPETANTCACFREVLAAATDHRSVRLHYYAMSHRKETLRTVDPYLLFLRSGAWYLHAWDHDRKATRDFAIHRIRQAAQLARTFTPPDLDAVKAHLAERFSAIEDTVTEVRIRFGDEVAPWVRERVWHPTQALQDTDDGGLLLTMRVSGLPSVMSWVLGFGRHAKAEAPAKLVKMLREEVAAMAGIRHMPVVPETGLPAPE